MTLSVALCTYNGVQYITEQLDSILHQTLPVSQIIICDDGSTDGTLEIITSYKNKYSDIISVYQNSENLGYVSNFEKAMSLCTGDLVFLSDQDDRWLPNKTSALKDIFEKHTETNLVCHNIKLFGESMNDNNRLTYWDLEDFSSLYFKNSKDLIKRILYQGNVFPGMAMVFRNDFLKKHLPLKKINKIIIHDYELFLLATDQNSVWIENSILGEYRIHPKQNIGFKTFSAFKETEEKTLSREQLFKIFQRYRFVKNTVSGLGLTKDLETGYKNYCFINYKKYLKSLSLFERFVTEVKMKYYFHIFDYLK